MSALSIDFALSHTLVAHEWFPPHLCQEPGLNFMFEAEPQADVTAEVSLVDHKEVIALLPLDPTHCVSM